MLQLDALNASNVRDMLKQVKGIAEEFKKVIAFFAKKYREMRYEWDRSFKSLLSLQVTQESQVIQDLKLQLERKQEELDHFSRLTFDKNSLPTGSAVKWGDNRPLITNSSF